MTLQLCNFIFDDLHRCGSPALRNNTRCYFHHPDRKPIANTYARRARRGFTLAPPRNQQDLQAALSEIITRLAANKIDTRRASLLLYSLQLASHNFG